VGAFSNSLISLPRCSKYCFSFIIPARRRIIRATALVTPMSRDIDTLNDEMVAAGVRIFDGGVSPAGCARSLRAQPDGKVLITDGPYLETNEHIGGFWVLEAANLDDALAWGRKAAVACRAPVEVRAFLGGPTEATERQ
jgi:hypothetical protein